MAYQFQTEPVSTIKFTGDGRELSIAGINGREADANVIVNGIFALLYLGDLQNTYVAEELVRTVKQDVNNTN